jgi:Fe-S cluster assembly protein SufB
VAEYEHGWVADIEQEYGPKGLSEDTVRFISAKKDEPEWMLEWRLKAYRHWLTMPMPDWAKLNIPPIDYQEAYYWAAPKKKDGPKSLDEVDPEILRVYEKLGIPLAEQEVLAGVEGARKVAVDAVFDSVSVATTFRKELEAAGVIFRSISEAIREYPDLVRRWLGKVVPMHDNFFAALNCAVFSDGTFVYIPEGVRCPMELSTYFRINAENTGQFERTLIVADKGAYVSYLEGCTAPQRDENQLHAAVVELVALDDAEIKYSTVQNWYPGDAQGKGGIYNFVTKRAVPGRAVQGLVDAGGNRLGRHVEVSQLRAERRGFGGRVLFGGRHQQFPAGRYRHQDDPQRQAQPLDHRVEGDQRGQVQQHLSRPGARGPAGRGRAQLHPVRQPAAGRDCGAHTVPYIEVKNPRPPSSTRRPPARSAMTSCSMPCSAGWTRSRPWR